jgi:hypothetical protein
MEESTLTIFPTSEYEALEGTVFAVLLSYSDDGEEVEPRVVYDADIIDAEEAEEVAYEILDLLQKRDIIIPQNPQLH